MDAPGSMMCLTYHCSSNYMTVVIGRDGDGGGAVEVVVMAAVVV